MRPYIYLRLPDSDDGELHWLRVTDDEVDMAGVRQGDIGAAAAEAVGCRVIVFVPGSDILLTAVTVPSRRRQDIIHAVPYALEEQLASDIDSLHFAVGVPDEHGGIAVAVVAEEHMEHWLGLLRGAGIEPDFMAVDLQAVPHRDGRWTLFVETHTALLRSGAMSGFAIDNENIVELLTRALSEAGEQHPETLTVIDTRDPESRSEMAPSAADIDTDIHIETQPADEPALLLLARGFDESRAINLVQGRFSRREQLGRILRPWRLAAAIALLMMVIGAGKTFADYRYLSERNKALSVAIEGIYRDTFPAAKRVVNARVQMQRQLDSLRKSGGVERSDFLTLLGDAGGVLTGDVIELQRLAYRDGRLDIAMTLKDLQMLEALKQSIQQRAPLVVEIRSATTRNDKVEAQLRIKGGGV